MMPNAEKTAQERQDEYDKPVTHGDLVSLNQRLGDLHQTLIDMAPHGDIAGHRKYHEALIEAQRRRAKIYDAIIAKTLTALLWAALVAVAIAVWHELQSYLPNSVRGNK